MGRFQEWIAYEKSYRLAQAIFEMTKAFPKEERYSLTDQIRRSSRSVCANLAESYARRKYSNYFVSKLHDCLSENAETIVWLSFSRDCGYISGELHQQLEKLAEEISKLLTYMINHNAKFC